MLWADQIPIVTLARLRSMYRPRRFRELSSIELDVDGVHTEIEIILEPGDGAVRGPRRWLRCHACRRRAVALGFVPGFSWSCRTCLGWRARARIPMKKGAADVRPL